MSGPPERGLSRARDWDTSSCNRDYDRALADVTGRVGRLVGELAATPCKPWNAGD